MIRARLRECFQMKGKGKRQFVLVLVLWCCASCGPLSPQKPRSNQNRKHLKFHTIRLWICIGILGSILFGSISLLPNYVRFSASRETMLVLAHVSAALQLHCMSAYAHRFYNIAICYYPSTKILVITNYYTILRVTYFENLWGQI